MKQSHYTIIAFLLIGAAFALAAVLYNSEQGEQQHQRVEQNSEVLIRPSSMRAGNPNAKVTIVEFMDPACETCRKFHPYVKGLIEQYAGKVNLVVRYAPLHKGSDQMVAILEAAKQQGQFWQVLELMFETQSQWASHHNPKIDIFWDYLAQAGFDAARLKQDVTDPEVLKVVQQDIEDGQTLGATKTPTFFVNGKPLSSFGYEQLRDLVASEVNANY